MNRHHHGIGANCGNGANLPVSPPISCDYFSSSFSHSCIDICPNEGYQGGVGAEGPGPAQEEEQEVFEECAPSAPSSPPQVSQAARDHHVLSGHVSYRSWCPHCVAVRGREDSHRQAGDSADKLYPILHWDYAFISSSCPDDDAEADKQGESPLL